MTNPVGQEQFESCELAAVNRHIEVQLLPSQGLATKYIEVIARQNKIMPQIRHT